MHPRPPTITGANEAAASQGIMSDEAWAAAAAARRARIDAMISGGGGGGGGGGSKGLTVEASALSDLTAFVHSSAMTNKANGAKMSFVLPPVAK